MFIWTNISAQNLKIYCTQQQHCHQISSSWIIKIFEYIVCRTKNITASNVLPLNTDRIHKYHPPKHSRAYYFSKSGNRIRKFRTQILTIDHKNCLKGNIDNTPDTHCQKSYHIVSKKNKFFFTYLILSIPWLIIVIRTILQLNLKGRRTLPIRCTRS